MGSSRSSDVLLLVACSKMVRMMMYRAGVLWCPRGPELVVSPRSGVLLRMLRDVRRVMMYRARRRAGKCCGIVLQVARIGALIMISPRNNTCPCRGESWRRRQRTHRPVGDRGRRAARVATSPPAILVVVAGTTGACMSRPLEVIQCS